LVKRSRQKHIEPPPVQTLEDKEYYWINPKVYGRRYQGIHPDFKRVLFYNKTMYERVVGENITEAQNLGKRWKELYLNALRDRIPTGGESLHLPVRDKFIELFKKIVLPNEKLRQSCERVVSNHTRVTVTRVDDAVMLRSARGLFMYDPQTQVYASLIGTITASLAGEKIPECILTSAFNYSLVKRLEEVVKRGPTVYIRKRNESELREELAMAMQVTMLLERFLVPPPNSSVESQS